MKNKFLTIGILIIFSALIWGLVMIGCSLALRGTGCYDKIQNILVGGTMAHLILIWGPLSLFFIRSKENMKGKDPKKQT